MKHVLAVLCAYEAIACFSKGRVPTITSHCGRRPVLGVVAVVALAVHLAIEVERRASDVA